MNKQTIGLIAAGAVAGATTGLFGGGGGMLLVPLLSLFAKLDEKEIFPTSVFTILPICVVSLLLTFNQSQLSVKTILMYLPGSAIGGILAGRFGKHIPTLWLHRLLGILILLGGIRYLC